MEVDPTDNSRPFFVSLLAGASAGAAVDTSLFPLDTIKTRLQSAKGFQASGGFSGVYQGLSSALIGSAPSAALFFCTYDFMKHKLEGSQSTMPNGANHMLAASCGEISACLVRVPTEVIKQRLQTGQYSGYRQAVTTILSSEGLSGFYRGYFTTVFREIPFTCIQFPLYEYLKANFATRTTLQGKETMTSLAAICGSVSGACAAFLTTPFDVAKTRIMLSSKDDIGAQYKGFAKTIVRIAKEEGKLALFKGAVPRVMWMSLGGAIFLGTYEFIADVFHH